MTPEELKKFIESKGYDHVRITVFKESFKVSYWEPDYKVVRNCKIPITDLPTKFDGSRLALWLENSFPSLYSEPQEGIS